MRHKNCLFKTHGGACCNGDPDLATLSPGGHDVSGLRHLNLAVFGGGVLGTLLAPLFPTFSLLAFTHSLQVVVYPVHLPEMRAVIRGDKKDSPRRRFLPFSIESCCATSSPFVGEALAYLFRNTLLSLKLKLPNFGLNLARGHRYIFAVPSWGMQIYR